jgi:hypothetical protein
MRYMRYPEPEPPIEPPEPKIIATCCECGGDIYDMEPCFNLDYKYMCVNCYEERAKQAYIARIIDHAFNPLDELDEWRRV